MGRSTSIYKTKDNVDYSKLGGGVTYQYPKDELISITYKSFGWTLDHIIREYKIPIQSYLTDFGYGVYKDSVFDISRENLAKVSTIASILELANHAIYATLPQGRENYHGYSHVHKEIEDLLWDHGEIEMFHIDHSD